MCLDFTVLSPTIFIPRTPCKLEMVWLASDSAEIWCSWTEVLELTSSCLEVARWLEVLVLAPGSLEVAGWFDVGLGRPELLEVW